MLGITLLLIVLAAFVWGVFRTPTRKRRGRAEDAARKAVEHRLSSRDDSDSAA